MTSVSDIWSADEMDRKPSCDFLTNYILSNPEIKVLNVNSPWGSGKTFFLTRWAQELSETHTCIFFNAWETDYLAEPLVALVTCIEQQTADAFILESTKATIVDVSTNLIKRAVPLIAKGLVKKLVGVDYKELVGDEDGEDVSDGAKDLVESLIKDQSAASQHVDEFKRAVVERLGSCAKKKGFSGPAFIFIDELDRCRPTYAIELLERIKHFFELEDCRFIVASDSTQLAHSIRAVYGDKFSSERYLSRFFDAEFRLDNSNLFSIAKSFRRPSRLLDLGISSDGYWDPSNYSADGVSPKSNTVCIEEEGYPESSIVLVGMAKFFKVQLREFIRYRQQILSMYSALPAHRFHFFWAAFLIFSKAADEELYQSLFVTGRADSTLTEFSKDRATPVTFAMRSGLEPLENIAKFYMRLIVADSDEMRDIIDTSEGWRSRIAMEFNSGANIVIKYRNVVELAHRLS